MSLKKTIMTLGLGIAAVSLSACVTPDSIDASETERRARIGVSNAPVGPVGVGTPIGDAEAYVCYGYKWRSPNGSVGKQHYPTFNACMTSQTQTDVSHEITSACSLKKPCSSF